MAGVINIKSCTNADVDFIGSRQTGTIIREEMVEKIKEGGGVTLDFGGINKVTQSFVDEFIGILTRAYGVEYITSNVRLVNNNKDISTIINIVISYSKRKVA